jgi:peroxiredoxin
MKALLFLVLFQTSIGSMAQSAAGKIPAFKLVLPDGSYFSAENLPKNKPLVLIYFAPDCDHCKTLMKDFFKRVNDFSETRVVMITYRELKEVSRFIQEYGVSNYPNITVGTEVPVYFIRQYYKLSNTPFTALFNKKGEMVCSYRSETPVADMVDCLKKMK